MYLGFETSSEDKTYRIQLFSPFCAFKNNGALYLEVGEKKNRGMDGSEKQIVRRHCLVPLMFPTTDFSMEFQ